MEEPGPAVIKLKRVAPTSQLGGWNLCVVVTWPNGQSQIVHYRRTENAVEALEWTVPLWQWLWLEVKDGVKMYFRPDLHVRRAWKAWTEGRRRGR